MHIILSPAKTMAGTSKIKAPAGTTPRFNQEAIEIALHMAQYPAEELGRMLKLSPKLMMESYHRFQNFHSAEEEPLQALLAYTGVVFKNINPKDFTEADFRFAQDHLRLVSICYGLLRPLDLIKPYRMEYDVKLPELGEGNMYIYWRARQTEPLIEEVKADDNLLINLGSMDLQPSFDWKKVEQSVPAEMLGVRSLHLQNKGSATQPEAQPAPQQRTDTTPEESWIHQNDGWF